MWTIVNLVDRFCDRYDFYIVTRNHDGRTDLSPYPNVKSDGWNDVGNARVFYASSSTLNTRQAAILLEEVQADLVFLNSVFSTPVLVFLNARRKGLINDIPVILAPCGELSTAALGLKSLKKKTFLRYARMFGLYRDIIWKATTDLEDAEIRKQIGNDVDVMVAPDLAPRSIVPAFDLNAKPVKRAGEAVFCFVSRLTRKKNLLYLLERLTKLDAGKITLRLIGPIEDEEYWAECKSVMEKLPPNVTMKIYGALPQPQILDLLFESHFFVLPTLNENFGYVFVEALAAGCPLLISDQTVWSGVRDSDAGWIAPLDETASWEGYLHEAVTMDTETYAKMAATARSYAVEWLSRPEHDEMTERVLARALDSGPSGRVRRKRTALL